MATIKLTYLDRVAPSRESDWYMEDWSGETPLTVEVKLDRPSHYHLVIRQGSVLAESTSIAKVDSLSMDTNMLVYTRSGAYYYLYSKDGGLSSLRAELRRLLS